MRSAEEWASSEFGFDYIDDVKPQTRTAFGTTRLLKQIESIQRDALREAAEIVNTLSRGTKSEDRSVAIDEAVCAILKRVEEMKTHNPAPTNR